MRRFHLTGCSMLLVLFAACTMVGEPEPLSHFKCYVASGEPIELEERLRLEDQFHIEEGVEVIGVRYFCNPVTKFRGEEPHPAEQDEDHLTCYLIRDEQRFWTEVDTRNQFGEARLQIRDDELLCVPTFKSEDFESIPPGTEDCPGGKNCCCEQVGGFTWPGCDPGFQCLSNRNVAGPNEFINVCVPDGTPLGTPLQLNSSQPPFCRP